ncbi:phosphotransferase family protein [Baekduia soli]|uniref:Phosphotransferase family protein n=1 Tax=Baekduia soli TaxID=496014 RepID=A0A5B8UC53_9ACTN|nr:phosphotransferase family protein [Baekduia soli]
MAVDQLAGGWSRHSYVATTDRRRLVVRVRPGGALLDTDLALEFHVYRALEDTGITMPRVHALQEDPGTAFGGPFFVMEHVEGEAPNMYGRADQARLAADYAGPRGIANDMVENLARVHLSDTARLPQGVPVMGFADVVARWRTVYEEKRLVRDPIVEEAYDWVAAREPTEPWTGLVHGDYRIGNMLVAGDRVRAILDWELVYVGDARFDLGYLTMARAAGKHLRAHSPLMGCIAEQEWFLGRYAELTGRHVDPEDLKTFEMLAAMMLLATQFTAVWMYDRGHTTDFRMAWSRFSLAGLRQDMARLMAW